MKIGIFDPYLDDLGGGEKYMMTIASYFSQKHAVNVFWNNPEDIKKITERFALDLSKVHLVENIFAGEISVWRRLLVTSTYDAIIFLSDGSLPLVSSKKLYIHIQQPLEQVEKESFMHRLKMFRVTKIFCNSLYTKSFIKRKLDKKIVVIYPPVAIHPKKIKKENVILNVGRFRVKNVGIGDYKKQGKLIDMFISMVDKGLKDWKFVLAVGLHQQDEEEFKKLEQKAKGYPIEFAINKSNTELWEYYNKAKIYWHASGLGEDLQKHPEYAEHFGISTVEAMGAGCVPIVINAGGQKEIVTEGKSGFLWETPEECMKKTEQVLHDKKLWGNVSVAAQERAKDFSVNMFDQKLDELLS